jgi:hypothetical protein
MSAAAHPRTVCETAFVLRFAPLALALLVLGVPSAALAHGGPPIVETLAFDPSDPTHLFAGTNFGTIVSHDGGHAWRWVCPSVVGLRPSIEDPLVLVSDRGTLFVGDTAGLWRGSADACDWSSSVAPAGLASGGAMARGAAGVLFAGTSTDGGSNSVLRSTDDGASWMPVLGPTIDVWFESILAAPSDAQRVYAVQNRPPVRTEPWETTVFRSDDGGDHWTSATFTLLDHEWRLYLLAVDPTDHGRLLAYTQNLFPGGHSRVMLSEDAGASWTQVLELTQVLGGAWAPDGSSAYVAGPVDGLWRSDDAGHTFSGVRTDLFLRCVVATADAVWVCADDFTAHFAVGRSIDRGASFETIARLRSIEGQPACGASTALAMTCPAEESVLDMALAMAPSADAGPSPIDAGAVDAGVASPPSRSACGCRAGGASERPSGAFVAFLALAAAGARAQRRARAK